jgi:hypothetical protein
MKTEYDQAPNKSADSFMEPRTIPKLWDVSAFNEHSIPSRNGNADQPVESSNLDSSNRFEDCDTDSKFDPFPQPRTIPGNWDVSDLV